MSGKFQLYVAFVRIYNRANGSFLSGLVTIYPKERGS